MDVNDTRQFEWGDFQSYRTRRIIIRLILLVIAIAPILLEIFGRFVYGKNGFDFTTPINPFYALLSLVFLIGCTSIYWWKSRMGTAVYTNGIKIRRRFISWDAISSINGTGATYAMPVTFSRNINRIILDILMLRIFIGGFSYSIETKSGKEFLVLVNVKTASEGVVSLVSELLAKW